MSSKDNSFSIEINKFYSGLSPLAFNNPFTETGGGGHASSMQNVDIINGDYITQGAGLTNLTNGTQAGVVTELIKYIMDKAVAADTTYGIGTSKLFKISSTAVASGSGFPHSISNCTSGESVQVMGGNLYYFYNTASAGLIGKYDLSSTFTDNWATGLLNAPHPSDKKEDIIVFGNGRYAGTFFNDSLAVTPTQLDFGIGSEVDDVIYNSGYWYLAVNSNITGQNRTEGQIYLYDGAALVATLADEAGVGFQRIGFLYRINGIIYVAYQDASQSGFIIGYVNGKMISPLARYTGDLPNFQQKTLYKNTILFLSSGLVYSAGAIVPDLPFQLSQFADGGYATCGAIACPFDVPMIASTDGAGNFKLAKFSGYDTASTWKSIIFPLSLGKQKGYIDEIVVLTKTLGAGASCSLTVEADQATKTSSAQIIGTTGKRRHYFQNLSLPTLEDFRIALDFSGGSTTNDCAIRAIAIRGHWVENT